LAKRPWLHRQTRRTPPTTNCSLERVGYGFKGLFHAGFVETFAVLNTTGRFAKDAYQFGPVVGG
jgi:hypothetical protein